MRRKEGVGMDVWEKALKKGKGSGWGERMGEDMREGVGQSWGERGEKGDGRGLVLVYNMAQLLMSGIHVLKQEE